MSDKVERLEINQEENNLNILANLEAIKGCLSAIINKIDGDIKQEKALKNINKRVNEYLKDYNASNVEKLKATYISSEFDFFEK